MYDADWWRNMSTRSDERHRCLAAGTRVPTRSKSTTLLTDHRASSVVSCCVLACRARRIPCVRIGHRLLAASIYGPLRVVRRLIAPSRRKAQGRRVTTSTTVSQLQRWSAPVLSAQRTGPSAPVEALRILYTIDGHWKLLKLVNNRESSMGLFLSSQPSPGQPTK